MPHLLDDDTIRSLAAIVEGWRDDIDLSVMVPTIDWSATASPQGEMGTVTRPGMPFESAVGA